MQPLGGPLIGERFAEPGSISKSPEVLRMERMWKPMGNQQVQILLSPRMKHLVVSLATFSVVPVIP